MTRAFGLVVLMACGDPSLAEFRVVSTTSDPLAGATELVLALEQGERVVAEARFGVALDSLRLSALPFGEGYRLRLDALAGPFLLARGRSLPFDVSPGGPSLDPDIYFAPIGGFAEGVSAPLDAEVVGLVVAADGALVASDAGTLYRYVHHRDEDGMPTLDRIVNIPDLSGARYAAHAPDLLAVGGAQSVARIVGADGSVGPTTALPNQGHGAVVVAFETGTAVLGGSDREFGAPTRTARVLIEVGGQLVVDRESELPCAVRDAPVAVVPVTSLGGQSARIVTVCDGGLRTSDLVAFNPGTGESTMTTVSGNLRGAALASLGPGLLLVTGGRDPEGALSDAAHVVAVGASRLTEVSPAPEPLFRAREGHAMIALRPGLALVVGGRDDGGAIDTSELVAFPGDVVLTGTMGFAASRPRAAILGDGVVLVVGEPGVSLYVVPR